MKNSINIGIVGTQFMGRAHANAWADAGRFYQFPFQVVRKVACDIDEVSGNKFAELTGWEEFEPSWQKLMDRDDIHIIDICTPNHLHMPVAVAAARAGKHVICEKPLAMNAGEAELMLKSASDAGIRHMTAFNYRRVPAIVLAKEMIEAGKLGNLHHFNAYYHQDWLVDPEFPWAWRHDVKLAGSGAHGDMNAHTIDLARFLAGDFDAVCGEHKVFTGERKKPGSHEPASVTADDATTFMARFKNGAMGNFQATRFATGRKNHLRLEIFGSRGSLMFNLERLNELEFYSRSDDRREQGFKTILVTENTHPYLNRWWPPGHIIGWEHTFIHEMGDFLLSIAEGTSIKPDFSDGLACQRVLDAVTLSASAGNWITV